MPSPEGLGLAQARLANSRRELALDVGDLAVHLGVLLHVGVDGADGMQDGGVVAAAEVAADFFQAIARVLAGEEHADLAREGDGFVAFFALEVRQADVVVLGDGFEDLLDGDALLLGAADFAQGDFG